MTFKQFLSNLKIKNLKFIIQAKYRKFIKKQYNKYFNEDRVEELMFKAASCPDCYFNGTCLKCGCNTKELFNSDKPDPDDKF